MKTFVWIAIASACFACNSDHEKQPPAQQPSPEVTTPAPEPKPKPDPNGTTIEMNNEGVNIHSKNDENKTDIKVEGDSSHVVIKRK